MTDIAGYLAACLANGTLLLSACALVVVPVLAWCAIRALQLQIMRLEREVGWQAPLAAVAAALPGALFLTLASVLIVSSVHSACLSFLAGRIVFVFVAAMTLAAIVRAVFLASKRTAEVRRLIVGSRPAGRRLERIAREIGVVAREVPYEIGSCFLAGIWRPVIIVSSGTLERLDDEGLRAVLLHERGHARSGDQLLAALVSLCVDVWPLPVTRLVETYRNARELAADRHAIRESAPDRLAEAILLLARNQPKSVAALTGGELRVRVEALFASQPAAGCGLRRYLIAATLGAVLAFGIAPAVDIALGGSPCATMSSSE